MKENAGNTTFRRTRLAPTPSGYLHLGNIYSFIITAALAKKNNAKVLLRIDDADRERTNKIFVQDIFDTLNFLEIPWDEGPKNVREYEQEYSQVHRMDLYGKALSKLREQSALFACSCSRADVLKLNKESIYQGTCEDKGISLDAKNCSWRLRTDHSIILSINDYGREMIETVLSVSMRDFVVRKRDGFPAYQLTSLVDDIHFDVDLIVRGDDLWPSTLAQHYLALQLGAVAFTQATFYHHKLLLDNEGNKLSKSLGATSVQYWRKEHKKPEDIYSYIFAIAGLKGHATNWEEFANQM